MIGVETFLPKYPDQHPDDTIFDLYEGETFNSVLFHKKEFNDLKLTSKQPELPESGRLYNHQKIIARFLSSHTLYDELLVFHSPGTGKTCTAIGAVEQVIHQRVNGSQSIKKALIIVPNAELLDRFREEIIFTCTEGQYMAPEDEDIRDPRKRHNNQLHYSKKLLKPIYSLTTHETFYRNVLQHYTSEQLKNTFSNYVVIIDEAHRIANAKSEKMYNAYYNFLHSIKNCKKLLLTGTPMQNSSVEIVKLINLILPRELQIMDESVYFTRDGTIIENQLPNFRRLFLGRVSYLKSKTNIQSQFIGKHTNMFSYPVYITEMSSYQGEIYIGSLSNSDEKDAGESFYHNSLQASLFVFPNNAYGSDGFSQFTTLKQNRYTQKFIPKGLTDGDTINRIRTFSSKYAVILKCIIDNPRQNCFVFTSSILEGGAVMFGLCLELLGYSRAIKGSDVNSPGKRYAILADEVGTDTKAIIKAFNRTKISANGTEQHLNRNGEYIQVLIGGRKIQEGVTFYSIQQIHIATPRWNMSSFDQIIARGNRMNAHRFFTVPTPIKVYLHIAVYKEYESTDIRLYRISQQKDYNIKKVEHILKTISMDCALTFERNITMGIDGSRECEYSDCLYRCEGVNFTNDINVDTFQLLYDEEYVSHVIQLLRDLFKTRFFITLREMTFILDTYTYYQIFHVLHTIIKRAILFTNRYGIPSFLHEENNVFYLTNNSKMSTSFLSSFYSEFPPIRRFDRCDDAVTFINSSIEYIDEQIQGIVGISLEEQKIAIPRLPLHIQEIFLETCISARRHTVLIQWLLDYYKDKLREDSDYIYSTLLKDTRRFDKRSREWSSIQIVQRIDNERRKQLLQSELGIFGVVKGNKFAIVDLYDMKKEDRIHSKNTGRVCDTYEFSNLLRIVHILNIPPDGDLPSLDEAKNTFRKHNVKTGTMTDDEIRNWAYWMRKNKRELCNKIETILRERDLFI